jgi:hypothetical protein
MIKDVELIVSPIVITVQPTGLLLIDLNRLEICFFQQQFIDFMITKVKNSSQLGSNRTNGRQGGCAVDGYWGSKTYNGVVNFQRNEGIAADGIVGPVTWEEFEDYRVYVGYLGSTQYYEWNYNLTDSYPATYLRDACYGWYIDVTTNNSEDYWHVDHDFERLTYMCL